MSDADQPKRTGRPPRFPEEGARVQLSVRLKRSIDKSLREAADRNSRSLAEEVEFRLNQSFESIVLNVDTNTFDQIKKEAQARSMSVSDVAALRVAEYPSKRSFSEVISSPDFSDYIGEQIYNSSLVMKARDERASEARFRSELDRLDLDLQKMNNDLKRTFDDIELNEGKLINSSNGKEKEMLKEIITNRRSAVYILEINISSLQRERDIIQIRFLDAKDRFTNTYQECREKDLLDKI